MRQDWLEESLEVDRQTEKIEEDITNAEEWVASSLQNYVDGVQAFRKRLLHDGCPLCGSRVETRQTKLPFVVWDQWKCLSTRSAGAGGHACPWSLNWNDIFESYEKVEGKMLYKRWRLKDYLEETVLETEDGIRIANVDGMDARAVLAIRDAHNASLEREKPEPSMPDEKAKKDRSYPHCDATGCKERQGSSLYCKDEACDTRMIFVEFNESFREDPKPDKPEPPDEDVAKQRWEWVPVGTGEGLVGTDESGEFIYVDTPQQRTLQAAAPELADALRMVAEVLKKAWRPIERAPDASILYEWDDPGQAIYDKRHKVYDALKKAGLE